jgi:hypothetical protein
VLALGGSPAGAADTPPTPGSVREALERPLPPVPASPAQIVLP